MELQYEVETWQFKDFENRIEAPRFQRGFVWQEKKITPFINTLKAGLPIGSLLLSKKDNDKYLIIDGLQRYTSMRKYADDPFKYIGEDEITDDNLLLIISSCAKTLKTFNDYDENGKKMIKRDMREIIKSHFKNFDQTKNLNTIATEITDELCTKVAIMPSVSDHTNWRLLQAKVFDFLNYLKADLNIDDIKIPVIIFKGSSEDLATIFEKLNNEGVKLSKYDIFAASWYDFTIKVDDTDLIEHVIDKYESAEQDADLTISGFDAEEMRDNHILTVFEYAYALGKELESKCGNLFNGKKDSDKATSIGFILLAEIMGLQYNDMKNLGEEIYSYKDIIDFSELKNAIVFACKKVEDALGDYITAPTKSRANLSSHADLQLASYILVYFKLNYSISKKDGLTKTGNNKVSSAVNTYLYKHYLYDIIRGYWSGSGDTKLEEIIEAPETCRYTKDVDKASFETALDSWLEEANGKKIQKNVTTETKLVLNYILRLNNRVNRTDYFDVEHCVPKDVIDNYYHKKKIDVPMSTVCNLAYIPYTENRSKHDKTYYQKQATDSTTYTLNESKLDGYAYPKHEELRFVESTDTLTEENYYNFLKARKTTLAKKLISKMYE